MPLDIDHVVRGYCCLFLETYCVIIVWQGWRGQWTGAIKNAQLQVDIEADGESVCVPVLVQPQSVQLCLLAGFHLILKRPVWLGGFIASDSGGKH